MAVTARELANPRRNVNDQPMTEDRCLCGKHVALYDNDVKNHRPKVSGDKGRKVRKGEWCQIPAILKKADESKSASGEAY